MRLDLPELAAHQFVPRITEKLFDERIQVQNLAGIGIDQENTVAGRFEQPAITRFGRALAFRDVLESHQDEVLRGPAPAAGGRSA